MINLPDGLLAIMSILAMLLVGGGAIGLFDRKRLSLRWLLGAAGLVLVHDAALSSICFLDPGSDRRTRGRQSIGGAQGEVPPGWRRMAQTKLAIEAMTAAKAASPVASMAISNISI